MLVNCHNGCRDFCVCVSSVAEQKDILKRKSVCTLKPFFKIWILGNFISPL